MNSIKHKVDCDFESIIEKLDHNWSLGCDDRSDYIIISTKEIYVNSECGNYPSLEFTYCPNCGVELN